MKITLINPSLLGKELRWDKAAKYPPLGICYLAAVLEKAGHKVNIIDADVLNLEGKELLRMIRQDKPDMVGLCIFTPKYYQAVETINLIREEFKDMTIIVGGPHLFGSPVKTLQDVKAIDYGIVGEGERTIVELVDALEKGSDVRKIDGLSYRDKKNRVRATKPRKFIENLDEIPMPARHLLPKLDSYKFTFRYKRTPVTSMITSRGCPFRCLFCERVFGKFYRAHSPEYVLNEIEMLVERYKIREIHFVDDLFALYPKRVESICRMIRERGLDLTWSCNGRVNVMYRNMGMIKHMKAAGCWYISFGIESGNQQVLDFIKKDITLDQVRHVVKGVHNAGIFTKGYFMLGHPVDTRETIEETIKFAMSVPFDGVQFSLTVPYPGTELHEIAKNYGVFHERYDHMSGHSVPVFIPKGLTEEFLIKTQKKAYRRFYFRPRYILREIPKISSLPILARYAERALTYFKGQFK